MPNKKSDAEFRKELINADMGVFNSITKRQTAARKCKGGRRMLRSQAGRARGNGCLAVRHLQIP